jgi:hypothetical protein
MKNKNIEARFVGKRDNDGSEKKKRVEKVYEFN